MPLSAPSLLALPGADVACCPDEEWKPIPDWPHEASTCGRIRSVDRLGADGVWRLGAILPQHPNGSGYLYVHLRDGKRRRTVHVAVAVLEAHRKLKPGPEYEACHGNGQADNHLACLRWDTKLANLAEMWEERRAVTGNGGHVTTKAFPQHGDTRHPSRHGVTGDGTVHTGRFSFRSAFPPPFASVSPSLRSLRSLRSPRKAA